MLKLRSPFDESCVSQPYDFESFCFPHGWSATRPELSKVALTRRYQTMSKRLWLGQSVQRYTPTKTRAEMGLGGSPHSQSSARATK